MSPAAESQWLAQLAAMRDAIAGLKLDQSNGSMQDYGCDLLVEDDDLTGDSGNDDIWDVFSEEEDNDYCSDLLDGEESFLDRNTSIDGYDPSWLHGKCLEFTSGKSGLDASELQQELSALLASDMRGSLISML